SKASDADASKKEENVRPDTGTSEKAQTSQKIPWQRDQSVITPSAEEIKKWSPQQVLEFLEKKKDELFINKKHIKLIEDQEVSGQAFVRLTAEKLISPPYNLPGGPAETIAGLIGSITGEEQAPATQALQLQIETEKRKRVETELSRAETELLLEREKRLRLDLEYKASISCYESILYATTHGLARIWEQMNPTHRQIPWFGPATEPLMFDQPPTSKVEQDYQDWFTKKILTQLDGDGSVKAVDSHQLKFLDGKAPDSATHTKGYSLTSHTVEAIGEIKCRGNCFTNTYQEQVLRYAILILNHQKNRNQITGFLTDCHHIMFIEVSREVKVSREVNDRPYSVSYSSQMSLSNQITTRYLRGLLSTIQYHPTTGLNVDLDDMIAYTPTSTIFSVVDNENAVVKLVNQPDLLDNEIRILKKLGQISGVIELVDSSTNAMLLQPRAGESFKESPCHVSSLVEIVDALYLCHRIHIVHGDVRLTNILVDKDRLILVDFGCGSIIGEQWNYCGPKLPFRSLRLMKSKSPIFIQPQDDLFMLVQSLYLHLHHKEVLATMIDLSDPSGVLGFWEKVFSDDLWGKMRVSCENLDYDALKECILQIP
ncbi:11049_t:CDS:2, partial [Ambispora gerdemannii]